MCTVFNYLRTALRCFRTDKSVGGDRHCDTKWLTSELLDKQIHNGAALELDPHNSGQMYISNSMDALSLVPCIQHPTIVSLTMHHKQDAHGSDAELMYVMMN